MAFDSSEVYLDFWRRHPALEGRWPSDLEEILAYDLHQMDGAWRVQANSEAILRSGADFAFDPEANAAAAGTPVAATLVFVDHGLLGQPGGFIPLETAHRAADANSNIELRALEGLNHYTLVFGNGATAVASVIAGS
jgi:hypothetical protein